MNCKRTLALLLALCLLLCLSACGASGGDLSPAPDAPVQTPEASPGAETPAPATAEPSAETVLFTDSTGRTVELPARVTKIAVSGPLTQIVMFALAPDLLAGVATEWDSGAAAYFDPKYYNLPVLGQLYGGKGEMNLEELLAAAPDLVLDVGEPKGKIAEDMDKLSEQTGIPFIHIDAYTDTMGEAYRTLGALLGLEEEAETLASYCDTVYGRAVSLSESLGEEGKVKLLYLLGDTGLNVIAKGSYHAEVIDLLADNRAVLDDPSSKGTGNETDMEQLLLWQPEVILFAPDSIYDKVGGEAAWQELTAIREGRYYKVPFGPYNWLGFPPSVQRYLGILWLSSLLYPEATEYDLYSEVRDYFRLFYHCELSEDQFAALTEGGR